MSASELEREVARRELRDEAGNLVTLVLYAPRADSTRAGTWVCRTEIITSQGRTDFDVDGSDSLQALSLGLASLRHGLKQLDLTLSWMGIEGQTGVPLVVQEIDEDLQNVMESLLNAELSRQAMWQREARSRRGR